jgi:putative FMN-dependent luciferase-like monooxygenase
MMTKISIKRVGFFTRLLDQADAAERYRLATAQIMHAERFGFDSAWIAQHHFHETEGGLPAPFVFLSHVAAKTSRIRLGTGIVTLPLELPVRVAEDAVVLDLMSGHRLEVGVGPGGNLTAFTAFGRDSQDRHTLMNGNLELMRTAWSGGELPGGDKLYPSSPSLVDRIWQATFTVEGARRAGLAGDGLMLSRTQPRSPDTPAMLLSDIQNPMIDAYLEALHANPDNRGRAPRILASRTVFVADDKEEAMKLAEKGLMRMRHRVVASGDLSSGNLVGDIITAMDVHLGTPDEVIASLQSDTTLERATDLTMQVHSIDPPHPYILRSIELFAEKVAPALGWAAKSAEGARRVA